MIARLRGLREIWRRDDTRAQVARELEAIEGQVANLSDAIALGGDVPALVARLQTAEQRRKELLRQKRMLLDGPSLPRVNGRAIERHARERLHTCREILRLNVEAARPLLRELLEDRKIHFTPITEADRRGYEFEGMPQRAAC